MEPTTEHYKKLIEILGKEFMEGSIESPYDFIRIANKGVNANVIRNFRSYFNLPLEKTAHMLNVSEPSIYRWTKAGRNLSRNVSVKIFEIADLFLYGIGIFGSKDNFFKWINLPNTALGGMQPVELVEIPNGVSKIRDELGRIEHGVYS